MRRILLVLTVALVMAAMVALTATSAFAKKGDRPSQSDYGFDEACRHSEPAPITPEPLDCGDL